ncbi:MAG: hypothetical protein WCS42_11045 [Verrucomicrobiota bacterium]
MEGGRKVFTQLNHLVPELGHVMHAAFIGPLGPIILVGIALAEVKNKLKEYNEELDKVTDAEIEAHKATIEELQTAWDNAKVSFGKYQAALAHAGEDNDPIKTAIAREKELEAARIEGSKKLIERLGKEEEAAIRRNAAVNGEDSKQTEEKLRAAREATSNKLSGLDTAKPAADFALMQAEFARRQAQTGPLAAREAEAFKAAFEANEKFTTHQKDLGDLRKKKDADVTSPTEALAMPKSASVKAPISGVYPPADPELIRSAEQDLAKATNELTLARRREAQLAAGITPEAKAKYDADTALEKARAATNENQNRKMTLPGEMQQAQAVAALKANPNAPVYSPLANLDSVPTGQADAGRTPFRNTTQGQARHDWDQLTGALEIIDNGGHLDQKQEKMIQQILQAATGQKVKHDRMVEVLEKILADANSRDAAFEKIVAAINRVKNNTDVH